jgi:hypothetical protein
VVQKKVFDIDNVMSPRLVFETETLLAKKMSEVLEMRGMDFEKLSKLIDTYLEKSGVRVADTRLPASEQTDARIRVSEQLAAEIYAFGSTGISLKMFAFALKILGLDSLKVELSVIENGTVPVTLSSPSIRLNP